MVERLKLLLVTLALFSATLSESKPGSWRPGPRHANWSSLITQPSAFVAKAQYRLRKRPGGYKPTTACSNYVGMPYLESIRKSRYSICRTGGSPTGPVPDATSSVDCHTAPFVRVGNSSKASVSLCHSQNLVLDSCAFLEGLRKGSLSKKFPLPGEGAVRLACDLSNTTQAAEQSRQLQWMNSIHHEVWWANATRDDEAVRRACAPDSALLEKTPTLFVLRDRHANYAHEMEVVSMAFTFLAALNADDVAQHGMQVVIVDKAPATGFLETWARISYPRRLRVLADDPFPPGTCFRSAYHVYTFAAGIGYNTNAATTKCESAVVTGLSNWLRQLYNENDQTARTAPIMPSAAAVAGPAAAEAGVRGLRPPAGGIVLKNVVWLSRRNLEVLRLLLNASVGWKSMRLVRNEDQVVAAVLAVVQEWNAESCLLRRFKRTVHSEYERSLTELRPVHAGGAISSAQANRTAATPAAASNPAAAADNLSTPTLGATDAVTAISTPAPVAASSTKPAATARARRSLLGAFWHRAGRIFSGRRRLQETPSGGRVVAATNAGREAAHQDDNADADKVDDTGARREDSEQDDAAGGMGGKDTGGQKETVRPSYMIANNIVSLDRLWEVDAVTDAGCRRTNVLFKFVEGDFNDMSYEQQLQTIFRTGVLAGVHGAGLAHGFYLQPGQSAVLQLLGTSYAKVAANNVFRNMAAGMGNHYEDVLYHGVDVNVKELKAALKRSMDFVARKVMEAQTRREGTLRLVLVDQSHFAIVVPPPDKCPAQGLAGDQTVQGAQAAQAAPMTQVTPAAQTPQATQVPEPANTTQTGQAAQSAQAAQTGQVQK